MVNSYPVYPQYVPKQFISTLVEDPRSPRRERRMGKPINVDILRTMC